MSAILSLPPGPNVATNTPPPDGGGDVDLAAVGDLGPFAALFSRLLGEQAGSVPDHEAGLALAVSETTAATDAKTDPADITALLPFLDEVAKVQEHLNPNPAAPDDAIAITTPPVVADAIAAISAGARPGAVDTDSEQAEADAPLAAFIKAIESRNAQANTQAQPHEPTVKFAAAMQAAAENASGETPVLPTQAAGAPVAHARHAAAPALPVAQPVGSPSWGQEVGNRIAWMATRQESRAELVLTPPQMGRVEVSLSVTGDQASANFVSANPAVREALEAALPRLREILADAGIQLGQAQVGAENARQTAQQDKNGDNPATGRGETATTAASRAEIDGSAPIVALKPGRGLVDVFA